MTDPRAEFARLRAVIEVRLAELREALDRHELGQRWDETPALERVERGLAELAKEID